MRTPAQQVLFVWLVLCFLLLLHHTKVYDDDYSLEKLKFGFGTLLLKVLPAPYHCQAYTYITKSDVFFPALSLQVWKHVDEVLRGGDVIQSSMVKSGTTWTRHILNQIRNKGETDFVDLLEEVPFFEFSYYPSMTWKEKKQYFFDTNWNLKRNQNKIRIVATHNTVSSVVPFRSDLKYVIVVRNPYEITASYFPFAQSMHEDFRSLYGNYYQASCIDQRFKSFDEYIYVWTNFVLSSLVFDFLKDWWPHKHDKNVFFIHYSDLTKNTKQIVMELARFLNVELTGAQLEKVLENISFKWMKENHAKFDGSGWPKHFESKRILKRNFTSYNPETFTRKGKSGDYKSELSATVLATIEKMITEQIPNKEMRDYLLK